MASLVQVAVPGGLRTRRGVVERSLGRLRVVSARNQTPAIAPTGRRIHSRSSIVRAGSAASSSARAEATRRRAVVSSGITRIRATDRGRQPNWRWTNVGASRTFSLSFRSVASIEVRSVFTSITAIARSTWRRQSTSIEPRSPNSEYVTSGSDVHPHKSTVRTNAATSAAWRASRSRSRSPPRQRTSETSDAPAASKIRRSVRSDVPSICPRSTREIAPWLTPARSARSICRSRCRVRSRNSARPIAASSTASSSRCGSTAAHLGRAGGA